jgi:hypothetical protein
MTETKKLYRKLWTGSAVLVLAASLWAQAPAPAGQSQPPAQEKAREQSRAAQQETNGSKISPQQADELFRSIDEILKFASNDTALPIKKDVKRKLTSRDEVVAYLEKNMTEDKDAQRLRRSELVLKKFGLLPKDFQLQPFLVALLKEQVAGYYDFKTKTVNMLDWVDAEQQKPVMAHELTHALQDQSFDLEKWMKAGDIDIDSKKHPTAEDLNKDEENTARQAVIEGQAMAVLIDYDLRPSGQTIQNSREIMKALEEGMLVGTSESPQFQNAPLYLKEAMTFPYRYGVEFVADLLAEGGKQKAFAGAFLNPPHTTREIMEPKTYLAGEKLPPMKIPDFDDDFKDYDRFDLGAVGEFDVAVLIDQYAGVEWSRQLYPKWRGGYYYAAHAKKDPNGVLGLVYVSKWANAEWAAQFAAAYAKGMAKRYQHVHGDNNIAVADLVNLESLTGKHTFDTEDGAVVIEVKDDLVFVTESVDASTTERLERDVLK